MDITTAHPLLQRIAETATAVGQGFNNFTAHLPATAAEITDLISKCFGVSSRCQELAFSIRDLRYEDQFLRYKREVQEIAGSLEITFRDTKRIIGEEIFEARERRCGPQEQYRHAWSALGAHFEEESGNRLGRRLEYYYVFLGGLREGVERGSPRDIETFDDLAERIGELYMVQKARATGLGGAGGGGLQPDSVSPPQSESGLSRPPSFERRRPSQSQTSPDSPRRRPSLHRPRSRSRTPPRHRHPSSPQQRRPSSPAYSDRPNRPRRPTYSPDRANRRPPPHRGYTSPPHHGYTSPPHHHGYTSPPTPLSPNGMEPGYHWWGDRNGRHYGEGRAHPWGEGRGVPPYAPEPPLSPAPSSSVFSSDASSRTYSSGSGSSKTSHWVKKVFESKPPSTGLVSTGKSGCWAFHRPDAIDYLHDKGFEKIQEIPFENGELRVSFWQEPTHNRSRMLCESRPPNKPRKLASKALTDLIVERSECMLRFSLKGGKERQYWAGLRFVSCEQLVVFFSIFLALRSHDSYDPLSRIADHKLRGEEVVFEEVIYDDRYQHFLKVLEDKESGCVRLQASVLDGPMARTPIWTSFITHTLHSPGWLTRPSSKIIHLAELHRYIFREESAYTPQMSADGMHELVFRSGNVADAFEAAVEAIVDSRTEEVVEEWDVKDKKKEKGKDKGREGKEKGKEGKGKDKGGGKVNGGGGAKKEGKKREPW